MKKKVFRTRILMLALSVVLGALMTACGSSGGDDSKDNGDGDGGGCQYSSINGTWQCTVMEGCEAEAMLFEITLSRTDNQITWTDSTGANQTVPLDGNTFIIDASDPGLDQETVTCTIINNCSMSCRDVGQNINSGSSWDCGLVCTR